MFERIRNILIKEFLEIKRDKGALVRLFLPLILQMLVFGYAATFDVWNVPTAILDLDHTNVSRDFVSHVTADGRFHIMLVAGDQQQIDRAIDASDAIIAMVIHPGFANLLEKGQTAPVQVIVDGTNSNSALMALGYVGQIVANFAAPYAAEQLRRKAGPGAKLVRVSLDERPWFNEELNSRWFFIPGLIGTLTLISVVSLTAFAIVREREVGTLEQIMVTPIRPAEFILGKTLPALLIGLGEAALVATFGILWFRLPFAGGATVLIAGTSLYLLATVGVGLLVSTLCVTQQQAFASAFFVMFPLFILSGFAFPISSMPDWLQWITLGDPLRYYLIVVRGTFLKGLGFDVLWPELAAMGGLAMLLIVISIMRFRKSLD
jgi:drug efflux transport system permease protein